MQIYETPFLDLRDEGRYDRTTMTSDRATILLNEERRRLLADVLLTSRLLGGIYMYAEYTAPWCMNSKLSSEPFAPFVANAPSMIGYHYLLEGEIWAECDNIGPIRVQAGEALLFPRSDAHLVGSNLDLPPVIGDDIIKPPTGQGLYRICHGGGGDKAIFICGFLGCDVTNSNPVIRTLPPMMIVRFEEAGTDQWVRSSFRLAAEQASTMVPGASPSLARLSELLLLEAVAAYASQLQPEEAGWIAGLRDPVVSKALAKLHSEFSRNWTLDDLCSEVGASRTSLVDRFNRLVGEAPMTYLSNWRLDAAARQLSQTTLSIAQISANVGYESPEAFSRAFKRRYRVPPATWRSSKRDPMQ